MGVSQVRFCITTAHHNSGRRGQAHCTRAGYDERRDAEVEREDEVIAVAGYPSSWEATRQTCGQREKTLC